jgi:hypothetical protein
MRFILKREPSEKTYTHGKLYAVNEYDGKEAFLCHTLEDVVRDAGVKIHGQTAIPKGVYELVVSFSNRFKKRLPLLLNVPNFEGIRIHGGNSENDSSGCVLVGGRRTDVGIADCAVWVRAITGMIDNAQSKSYLEIA